MPSGLLLDFRHSVPLDLVDVTREKLESVLLNLKSEEEDDASRNAKLDEILELTEELIRIGRKPADTRSSSHFLLTARGRARQIGKRLDVLGGLKLMRRAHTVVESRLGGTPARELEAAWGGVDDWLS
jgi:hypothetical protein